MNEKRTELLLARAQGVLEDMPLRQREILARLSGAERKRLAEQLGQVAERLRAAQDEPALLHAASDLLAVVENQPALRELLLPAPWIYGESAAQREAWLEEWQQEAPPGDDQRWQELIKLRNIMITGLKEQIAALLGESQQCPPAEQR